MRCLSRATARSSSIAIHPDGKRAIVSGMHANRYRGLTLNMKALSHKTTIQAVCRIVNLETGKEVPGSRLLSSFEGQPVSVPVAMAMRDGDWKLIGTTNRKSGKTAPDGGSDQVDLATVHAHQYHHVPIL